jgi:guanine nucleotide-binding protein subunit alpha, other
MRLIHRVPFSSQEVESYRQLVFNNLTHGLKYLLDAMEDMNLEVSEDNVQYIQMIEDAQDIRDGQPFPEEYIEPLQRLWEDPNVQKCWDRGNEAALPDKYVSLLCYVDMSSSMSYIVA